MQLSRLKSMLAGNFSSHDLAHVDQVIGAAIVAEVANLNQLHDIVVEVIEFQDGNNIRPKTKNDHVPTGQVCQLCGGAMVRYPCPSRGVECLECGNSPVFRGKKDKKLRGRQ
jgi:hypothetical protein